MLRTHSQGRIQLAEIWGNKEFDINTFLFHKPLLQRFRARPKH